MRDPSNRQESKSRFVQLFISFVFLCTFLLPADRTGMIFAGPLHPTGQFDGLDFTPAFSSSYELTLPSELPHLLELWDMEHGSAPESIIAGDSLRSDSAAHAMARRLLPEHMSIMEKGMWGESGFLRSIGIASPLTPEVRKSELSLRRTMLSIHQIGGFVTLGLMITTVYYGQQLLNAERGISGRDPRDFRNLHQSFVTATIISYSATGLLSILSPPPLIRREETSTTTIHKTLAWIHVAGMIVTPIVGSMIYKGSRNGPSTFNDKEAQFHQISAYVTTAALAASMIVVTF